MSTMGTLLGRVGVVFGMVSKAFELLEAGYSAMHAETRVIKAIAASHAYGYWQFNHCNRLSRPVVPPPALQSHWHHIDQSTERILERSGTDTSEGRNKRIRMREWRDTIDSTIDALNGEYNRTSISLIYVELERRLPYSNIRNLTNTECRSLLKTIACQDYNRYPSHAAYLYHLALANSLDSNAKRAFLTLYPRYSYDPAIRC